MTRLALDRERSVVRYALERQAEADASGTCVILADFTSWTWGEALTVGYRAANVLRDRGVTRGQPVLIMLPNGADFLASWWGISFLGGVIVPVNTAYRGDMLRHLCVDSGARLMITTADGAAKLAEVGVEIDVVDPHALRDGQADPPALDAPIEPWDLASVVYTSGTTGPAKGVVGCHHMAFLGGWGGYGDQFRSGDLLLLDLPFFHISAQLPALAAWSTGIPVAIREYFVGSEYLELTRKLGATLGLLLGTMAAYLESTPADPHDADNPLRYVIAAPLPADPYAFMHRFGIEEMSSMYGMSETPLITKATLRLDDEPRKSPRSVGTARDGLELRLVDEHDIEVPDGTAGEAIIRVDGPWEMTPGYLNRPEDSLRLWRNGWLHTGDMLVRDGTGEHRFLDRAKDSLRRRGENISSFQVENDVRAHPDVADVACVAAPGALGDDEVKIFVVPREGTTIDPLELTTFLVPRMPYFTVPRYIEVIDELPKTQTMKVQKHVLRDRGNSASTWDREVDGGIKLRRGD